MKYQVFIDIPTLIEVEANSESEAIQKVRDSLTASKQIKPAENVTFRVASEAKISE